MQSQPDATPRTKVGWVEITGFHWTRRPERQEWALVDGSIKRKKDLRRGGSSYHFFPYSVGLLQAYAQRHAEAPDAYEFMLPVYRRMPVEDAVQQVLGCDVLGISLYCWNQRHSLEVARRVKELRPETLIVVGGPQVPDRAEGFLRRHPFLDLLCHGEGEPVFLKILERWRERDWTGIPGISFIDGSGGFVTRPKASRLGDLNAIPSPYLAGAFDALIAANPDENWQVLWETNRGCPFSCTFCDWGSAIAGKVYQFEIDRLRREIDWMSQKKIGFIFVCDANFGMLPRDLEIAEYVSEMRKRTGYPLSLGVQNTKNATERAYKVQTLLHSMSTTGVTIALQSNDPGTLLAIKRDNISKESFQELQRRYTRDRIETYTDMIIGLPGESYQTFTSGVSDIIANGQHNRIQFYNCYILPNAEMGDPEYRRRFGMLTVESRMSDPHDLLVRPPYEVDEYLELVITTNTMPATEWVRTKAFCWMTELIYFSRLLQLPFVLAHELYGVTYRDLIELASEADPALYPVLGGVRSFFLEQARAIQQGGEEYIASERWLGVRWPAYQLALIKLCSEYQVEAFYAEMERALGKLLSARGVDWNAQAICEAFALNSALLRQPYEIEDLELVQSHNVWGFYQAVLTGASVPFEARTCSYSIERTKPIWLAWEDWAEDVIARFNRKSAYLYPVIEHGVDRSNAPQARNRRDFVETYMVGPQLD